MMWMSLFFLIFISSAHICASQLVTVNTTCGKVTGYKTNYANVFYGIPFAQPPTGSLRWKPTKPVNPWSPNTINATVRPPACMQSACNSNDTQCVEKMSEDCLYLNIFTPLQNSSTLLPVMIFIHGGCFFQGGASIQGFQADRMVNTSNVIVVFIQYRLGLLGFLANGSSSYDFKGNYGILDQQMAINWTSLNIKAFGGDPNKITLFGESAGAQSTAIQYLSNSMQSYFQGAIIQSAPFTIKFRTYAEYQGIFDSLCDKLNCKVTYQVGWFQWETKCSQQCMSNKNVKDIIKFQDDLWNTALQNIGQSPLQIAEPWGPVVDGDVVRGQILDMFSNSSFQRKPVILGTNGKEMLGLVYMFSSSSINFVTFNSFVGAVSGPLKYSDVTGKFTAEGDFNIDQRPLLARFLTEWMFSCSARSAIRSSAANASTYAYVFNYPVYARGLLNFPICEGQPCHGYELASIFQSYWNNMTSADQAISKTMVTYWTNFAYNKDPNIGASVNVTWPKFTGAAQKYMTLDTSFSITTDYLDADCNTLDTVGYNKASWF